MSNILYLSDSVLHATGYANQTRLLCKTLSNANHTVYQLGHNHYGMPIKNCVLEDGEELNYTLLGTDGSMYCKNVLPEYMKQYRTEVYITLLDTFMIMNAYQQTNPQDPTNWSNWNVPNKSIFWFPSDGSWFPRFCDLVLKKYDYPVSMSKWGQDQIKRLYNMDVKYIPHGVKTDQFYPYTDKRKQEIKLKYSREGLYAYKNGRFFSVQINLLDKYVFGCVARNQGRKSLPELIQAFCEFAKDKPDVVLIMHSDPNDQAAVVDLQEMADRSGMGHKILWTAMRITNPYTTTRMNELYNVFDCFALLTTGEGFGIPFIESMACGVPVIATDFTTTKELITDNNAGLGVKLMGEDKRPYPGEQAMNGFIIGTWGVGRAFADFYDAIAKFNYAYTHREEMKEMGRNGRNAVLKYYDWDGVVGPTWVKFIAEITK